jgi:hypothetical protein
MTGTITAAFLCGSTLFVRVSSPSDQVAWYEIPWTTAQTEGIPGVISAIESAGMAWAQPVPSWVTQLTGQVVAY